MQVVSVRGAAHLLRRNRQGRRGSSIQSADIKMSKLKIPPELFGKVLVFIRFDDYNYIVIL